MGAPESPTDPDRQRGFLTVADREYLIADDLDLDVTVERQKRYRIRNRLRASILDIALVISKLPLDDTDKALSEPEDYEPEPGSKPPLLNSLPSLATLAFLALSSEETGGETDITRFLAIVEKGIQHAVTRRDKTIDTLELEGHLEYGDPLTEVDHDNLAELPRRQLNQLHSVGLITDEEFAEAIIASSSDSDV